MRRSCAGRAAPREHRHLVSTGVGSPAGGPPGGAAAAPALSSGLALERRPLTSWQPGNHSLGDHGSAARSLGARPPNPGQGLCAPRNPCGHRHHLSALGLRRQPPLARSGILPTTLGISGVGPSPQPRHERRCFFLRCGSAGQYVPVLSLCLSVRARLDVRVSPGLVPPRGNDSRRFSQGDAIPPLRDLSRRRSGQGDGPTMVERRGDLADRLSAHLQHFRSQLAGEAFLDPHVRGLEHAAGGDWLRVLHLAAQHAQGVGHRDDRIAPGRWPVHGAGLFLECDDSPDGLFLSDPRGSPGARRGMRRPRQLPPAVLVVMGLAVLGHEASGETGLSDDFAPLVRRLMARDQIPGLAVGVVERGHLAFARGFGYRDVDKHLPVTPDTLFPLGSCSKAFTATAIALLADEGRIALDTPVRTYLPDFSLLDGVASATLTPRDLLTHKSGLPRHDLFWYQAPFSRDELYGRLRFLEPSGPPRTQWRYNSLMFVVAGRIVEKVSGESWERFVASRILVPLDMRRTLLSAEAMEADADHASPYAIREGRVQKIPMLKGLSAIAPAGAVQTSVRDLARWLTFHATRSPGLLGEGLWRELHRPQAEMPAPDQPEVQHPRYALGWIHESYRGHPLVVHNGSIDGFTVHLSFLPETGQGLIILMNRDNATDALTALA